MSLGSGARGAGRRRVRVELTVEGLSECGGPVDVGLQSGGGELDGGTPLEDGAVRYMTDITAGPRRDGSVTWSGPAVQGTAADRFLYVSFRSPGNERDWIRRFKVGLPDQLLESTTVLRARVKDTGVTRPTFVGDGWAEQ